MEGYVRLSLCPVLSLILSSTLFGMLCSRSWLVSRPSLSQGLSPSMSPVLCLSLFPILSSSWSGMLSAVLGLFPNLSPMGCCVRLSPSLGCCVRFISACLLVCFFLVLCLILFSSWSKMLYFLFPSRVKAGLRKGNYND